MRLVSKNKYILLLVLISVIVAVLMHFPEIITLIDNDPAHFFPGMSGIDVISEVAFTSVSLLLLFGLNISFFSKNGFAKSLAWKRVIFALFFTWSISNILWRLFLYIHTLGILPAVEAIAHNYLHPLRDFIITFIVVGISYIIYLIQHKQQIESDYQRLHSENLINKYESLKNQLNPHMMFNSLNTLRSLIPDSSEKAQDYIQELSYVLRYTLQDNLNKKVSVQEEMEFVNSFIFLLKMRYEDNLIFDIYINKEVEKRSIPPMAIQLLIENAVKHNEISNRNPLIVTLKTEENQLKISNVIQPKRTPHNGLGIGLSNLSKRYQLMFKKEIEINKENGIFTVTVPLV